MTEPPEPDDEGRHLLPTDEQILSSLVLPGGFHDRSYPPGPDQTCVVCGARRGDHAALSPINDERWCPLTDQSAGGREKFHATAYFRPADE